MNDARYSLIIGINGYKPAIGQLRFCAHDAKRVDDALKMQRVGFATTESILFTDEDEISPSPTRVNIMESVMHLCDKSNYKDTVLIFFSGHGTVVADDELYLLPIDASPAIIEQSAIAWKWLRDKIEQAPAKNKILILDACHSGAGRDIASDVRTSFKIVNQIEKNKGGFVCLTSCSAGQLSYELPDIEQGIFSYYLANGLNGAADRLGRGVIEIESLYEFVRDRTIQHARQIGVEQVPHLISRIASPLSTFVISSAASDRPIRHVLVLTEDPLIGKFIELGIERSAIARNATWVRDIETVKAEIHSRFDYDAIYIDVDNEWSRKKEGSG